MSDRESEHDDTRRATEDSGHAPSRSARLLATASSEPTAAFETDAEMPHPEELTWERVEDS